MYIGGSSLPVGAMLMLHLPQIPLMFGIGMSSAPDFAITVDYWGAKGSLTSLFGCYLGVGGYVNFTTSPGGGVEVGGRLPLGFQVWPVGQILEVYLEVAPEVGLQLVPVAFDWHIQAALGLRFWF